jgi:hypothetical protein
MMQMKWWWIVLLIAAPAVEPLFDAEKVMGQPRSSVKKLLGNADIVKANGVEVFFLYEGGKVWAIRADYPRAKSHEAEIRQRLRLPDKGPAVFNGRTYILDCDDDGGSNSEGEFWLSDKARLDANKAANDLIGRKYTVEKLQRAAADIGFKFRVSLAGSDKATLRFVDNHMSICTEFFVSSLVNGSAELLKDADISERLQAQGFRRIECRDSEGSDTRDLPP